MTGKQKCCCLDLVAPLGSSALDLGQHITAFKLDGEFKLDCQVSSVVKSRQLEEIKPVLLKKDYETVIHAFHCSAGLL